MNQSATLAAAILAAFGLFIASRERLPVYARILWGDKPGTHSEQPEGETGSTFEDLFSGFELPDLPELPDFTPGFNWAN